MNSNPSPLRGVRAALDEADRQLVEIEAQYEASLRAQELPDRLLVLTKGVLDNSRSALDFIAYELLVEFGEATPESEKRVQYPICGHPNEVAPKLTRFLPGVDAYPPAADLVRMHQPFEPGHEWMKWLSTYVNPNKHRRLTAQTRVENRRIESGGVSWDPVSVVFGPGVEINGIPVDQATQRPPGAVTVTYVDWFFADSELAVRSTLMTIVAGLRAMVSDFELELGW